jgi:23S rRNA (adenine2503-C2)-methyltransferase
MKPALSDFDVALLARQIEAWGGNPAQGARLLKSFYRGAGRVDVAALRVGKALERRMAECVALRQSRVVCASTSSDGTVKFLVGLEAGGAVEAVLMPSHRPGRAAGCVSSQIGCAMGCDFCASTRGGLARNLTSGEIVEQFLHLGEQAQLAGGRRLSSLVFMGMGEPMHNLDHVIEAIRRITGKGMGALGARHVTVSTVGIVPGIDQLAEAELGVHLAISLHGPDDETRGRIVPMNRKYRVADIVSAARRYQERSGRITTIEYTMLGGVNDSDEQAAGLASLLEGFRAHVNLIPYNPIGVGISGRVYLAPSRARMERFLEMLRGRGVVAHFRRTRGDDVSAACGQLARAMA